MTLPLTARGGQSRGPGAEQAQEGWVQSRPSPSGRVANADRASQHAFPRGHREAG